jgi:hypothetical protein
LTSSPIFIACNGCVRLLHKALGLCALLSDSDWCGPWSTLTDHFQRDGNIRDIDLIASRRRQQQSGRAPPVRGILSIGTQPLEMEGRDIGTRYEIGSAAQRD